MTNKYILALDQGTTSSRSIIFNNNAKIVSQSQKEHQQIFPQPGWVEHDANEIWKNQLETALEAISQAGISKKNIAAIGITNQRETSILWSKSTGLPIYNAIVWQDRRTSEYCDKIRAKHENTIKNKTGLPVDAYFSASKINWILKNTNHDKQDLLFGTIDSWLTWKLSMGKSHITDVSNAARTSLFNIRDLKWDEELLNIYEIPKHILPNICESSGKLANCEISELSGIPICGIAGDQQAALFGQECWKEGKSKNTYGTGCFFLENAGTEVPKPNNNYLSTIAWKTNNTTTYAIEGSVFIAGAAIQWLRDGLGIINKSSEVDTLAESVSDSAGVYFVPAFTGLGTPYWNQEARGLICGLTRGSTKAHIARATLEAIAYQVAELVEATGKNIQSLAVDGGAAKSNPLLQFQADILQIPIIRSEVLETTALGAAYLAGLGCGYWGNISELENVRKTSETFNPQISKAKAEQLFSEWKLAVRRATFQTSS